jgi:hypothetical protein
MPLNLNVGCSRKVGEANYGSRGASVNLQLELESSLASNTDRLQDHIRRLFSMARASVEEELSGNDAPAGHAQPAQSANAGHQPNGTNGSNGHRASQKQCDYIRQLAGQIHGLGMRRIDAITQQIFSKPMADLTSLDASGLIDILKSIKSGEIELEQVLDGAAS